MNLKVTKRFVADANCHAFHYTQAELDEIERQKKEAEEGFERQEQTGLRKFLGYY